MANIVPGCQLRIEILKSKITRMDGKKALPDERILQKAYEKRSADSEWRKNLAVFLIDDKGKEIVEADFNREQLEKRTGTHAEMVVLRSIQDKYPGATILQVYTERYPCGKEWADCERNLTGTHNVAGSPRLSPSQIFYVVHAKLCKINEAEKIANFVAEAYGVQILRKA